MVSVGSYSFTPKVILNGPIIRSTNMVEIKMHKTTERKNKSGLKTVHGTHGAHRREKALLDDAYRRVKMIEGMKPTCKGELKIVEAVIEEENKKCLTYSLNETSLLIGEVVEHTKDRRYPIDDDEFLVPVFDAESRLEGYYVCRRLETEEARCIEEAILKRNQNTVRS